MHEWSGDVSYYEAIADNIPMRQNKYRETLYYPPCHICGKQVMSYNYKPGLKYTCKDCKALRKDVVEGLKENIRRSDKYPKLDRAIRRINAVTDIDAYKGAIEWVEKHLGEVGWFQSTEEIMVALELIKQGVKAHHQVKINKYRADFVLPDDKIVLEIDGTVFHRKDTKDYEKYRDSVIVLKMGLEWEVIRVSTADINKNVTKLYPAIKAIQRDRLRKRKQHGGLLPYGQSYTAT
jgi:very-short-patch-repair endonuclease